MYFLYAVIVRHKWKFIFFLCQYSFLSYFNDLSTLWSDLSNIM